MSLIETECVVLKTYNLADADKIVVLLTHDHGVVRGVAKGIKRLNSRFGSGLEPFSIAHVTYFQKETSELSSIQKVDIVKSYFTAASDPEFLQKFSYLADLVITFSPPHDPNEKLYRMTKACIETAAADPKGLLAIGVYFELWLLRLSGFLPDWGSCDQCRRVFDETETVGLLSNFHLICTKCSSHSRSLDKAHREIYSNARRLSPVEFAKFAVNYGESLAELSHILKRIISFSTSREVGGEVSLKVAH